MSDKKQIETFYPTNKQNWRKWLQENHKKEKSIWIIYYKKKTKIATISWSEAVDEALCFGWIDSTRRSIDNEKSMQYFSVRKAKSTWSRINKEKIKNLIESGQMAQAGLKSIEVAKGNGSWTILDQVEDLIVPTDLEKALKSKKGLEELYLELSKTAKKGILLQLVLAKRVETRQKRINDFIKTLLEK